MKHTFSSFYKTVKVLFDPAHEGTPYDSQLKEAKEAQVYRYQALKISRRLIVR